MQIAMKDEDSSATSEQVSPGRKNPAQSCLVCPIET